MLSGIHCELIILLFILQYLWFYWYNNNVERQYKIWIFLLQIWNESETVFVVSANDLYYSAHYKHHLVNTNDEWLFRRYSE